MERQLSKLPPLFSRIQERLPDWTGFNVAVVSVVIVSGSLLGVRAIGGLERLELAMYDLMVRQSPELPPDERITVVAITEADIQAQRRWPLTDAVLAEVLRNLQAQQPRVIGLDLYREFAVEPGSEALTEQLQASNVVAIETIPVGTLEAVPPPPASPSEQVGFNNLPTDLDNVVRRAFLYLPRPDGGVGTALGMQLALRYLAVEGIEPIESSRYANTVQLGDAPFLQLTPTSGGYEQADAGGYQMLLNYRGAEEAIATVTLSEVLAGEVDPELVRDRIVLIGSSATSLLDRKPTPHSVNLSGDGKVPGVVIHAQVVSQIIDAALGDRPLFRFWPAWAEVVSLIASALLSSIVAWRLRHPILLISCIGGGIVLILGGGFALFATQSLWIPIITPVLGVLLTAALIVTYQSYDDHCRRQIVMQLLGQNTSPEIAEALWQGRDKLLKAGKLPGIRLTATILFLDIKGFSTVSEKMEPEELLDWLNDILGEITSEVLSREGIVNKFTGDGVLAIFGVPLSRIQKAEVELDAQHAVYCALAISDRLTALNQRNHDQGLPDIQMRIGIFTGPVVVGSLGGKDRLEYGVLGDSVNTASRLESCEKHRQPTDCRVLIAKETLQYLGDRFEVEGWGPLALKGKQQMIEVFRVVKHRIPEEAVL
ncbi:CHASE2 domain-containing protein [Spirulina major]|uniref:CHASE2 domain-containing protein n=1 Tax=Spirulina major TaxID=270636 RepID=UPI000934D73E|nr:adenylate/guanylate cyclase domain-containing protein [Spirulina major]